MSSITFDIPDLAACEAFAHDLARHLRADDWLLLEGQMGAGKTTLVRFLVGALGGDQDRVSSPSYALMNHYQAQPPVWHVDVWRLASDEDFANLGLDDLAEGGICVVEWPSRIPILGRMSKAWHLKMTVISADERRLLLSVPTGCHWSPAADQKTMKGMG